MTCTNILSVVRPTTYPQSRPKLVLQVVRFSASSFSFPVSSLFIKVIQQTLTYSSSSSRHFYSSLHLSFNNVFQRAVRVYDVTSPVRHPSKISLFSLTLCNTSFLVRSVQLISTLHQHHMSSFQVIPKLLSDVSKFQHHTKLYSTCSNSLVSSLNFSPITW